MAYWKRTINIHCSLMTCFIYQSITAVMKEYSDGKHYVQLSFLIFPCEIKDMKRYTSIDFYDGNMLQLPLSNEKTISWMKGNENTFINSSWTPCRQGRRLFSSPISCHIRMILREVLYCLFSHKAVNYSSLPAEWQHPAMMSLSTNAHTPVYTFSLLLHISL